jgi:hypothetical protein
LTIQEVDLDKVEAAMQGADASRQDLSAEQLAEADRPVVDGAFSNKQGGVGGYNILSGNGLPNKGIERREHMSTARQSSGSMQAAATPASPSSGSMQAAATPASPRLVQIEEEEEIQECKGLLADIFSSW